MGSLPEHTDTRRSVLHSQAHTHTDVRDLSADNAAWQRDFLFPAVVTSTFSLAGSV